MLQAYADASALESVALQAAMVFLVLLLQKSHPKSKSKGAYCAFRSPIETVNGSKHTARVFDDGG